LAFKKGFYRNILKLGGYQYSSEFLSFLASMVLARLLLPREYGMVAMITVFAEFAMIFSGAGISSDIIRSNYKFTYHKSMANLSLTLGFGLFFLLSILAYPIALFYENMKLIFPTIVISIQFIFKGLVTVHYALLSKELKFAYLGKVTFFTNLVSVGLMIILAYLGFSYWALIIPLIITEFLRYLYFSKKTGLQFKVYPWRYTVVAFRKAKSIIGNITGFKMINYWARNVDNILIGKMYGESSLGIYNRGYRFLNLSLKLITRLFGTVMYPSLKKLSDEGGSPHKEYLNILGVISLLSFPIGFILVIFPQSFVQIVWGSNWLDVAKFLPYFGLLVMAQTIISTTGNIYVLFKKESVLFIVGTISAGLMVGAIVLGALSSVFHVVLYYSLCYLALIVPIQVIFGFIRSFGYSVKSMIFFWAPKLSLYLGMWFTTWQGYHSITSILMGGYFLHLLYFQRRELLAIIKISFNKFNTIVFNGK
jgi:O-antigen/teichoic acid export membrane protein